jgi:hypothetical protein
MSIAPHEIASEVTAEEGEVHIDGPGGLAMSMTPEAAAQTADRLHDGAKEAHGQRKQRDQDEL